MYAERHSVLFSPLKRSTKTRFSKTPTLKKLSYENDAVSRVPITSYCGPCWPQCRLRVQYCYLTHFSNIQLPGRKIRKRGPGVCCFCCLFVLGKEGWTGYFRGRSWSGVYLKPFLAGIIGADLSDKCIPNTYWLGKISRYPKLACFLKFFLKWRFDGYHGRKGGGWEELGDLYTIETYILLILYIK